MDLVAADSPVAPGLCFQIMEGDVTSAWRAIAQSGDGDTWYCFPLNSESPKAVPWAFPATQLLAWHSAGRLSPLPADKEPTPPLAVDDPSDAAIVGREENWKRVEVVLEREEDFLDHTTRAGYLEELHQQHGWSPSTMLVLMARHYRLGMVLDAQTPWLHLRGGAGLTRGSYVSASYQLTAADEKIIDDLIGTRVSSDTAAAKKKAAKLLLSNDESVAPEDESPTPQTDASKLRWLTAPEIRQEFRIGKARALGMKIAELTPETLPEGPSVRQVEYRIQRVRRTPADAMRELSNKMANSRFRPRTGAGNERAVAPGELTEVDCLHASELELVLPGVGLLLPRLRIWIGVDVGSGLPRGFYADLRAESSETFLCALYHLFVREPGTISRAETPPTVAVCDGLSNRIRVDGISRTYASDEAVRRLGLEIETTPPGRPEVRPFVESFNESMRLTATRGRPGAQTAEELTLEYARSDATLTLRAYLRQVSNFFRAFGANAVNATQWPPASTGLFPRHPSRAELFNMGGPVFGVRSRVVSLDLLRRVLLPVVIGEVTDKGIVANGARVTFDTAEEEKWTARGTRLRPEEVPLRADPSNAARFWYENRKTGRLEPTRLLPGQDGIAGLHAVEWALLRKYRARQLALTEKAGDDANTITRAQNQEIDGEEIAARRAEKSEEARARRQAKRAQSHVRDDDELSADDADIYEEATSDDEEDE